MKDLILSTITGAVCGFIFARLHLPIPAPGVLAGIMGILGIFIGYKLAGLF
jgi:XapX domain-containing protein